MDLSRAAWVIRKRLKKCGPASQQQNSNWWKYEMCV